MMMNKYLGFGVALAFAVAATQAMAAAGVDFGDVDTAASGFTSWLRGPLAVAFFTAALAFAGLAASFNKISWMWVLMIVVGAFLVFGGAAIVSELKSLFG